MYAIAVCTLYYRELTFKGLLAVSARAARTTSVVMLIVATATAVGWFITSAQIPMQVAELFQPLVDSPILLLLSINVFLFLAGMVMDLTPNVLIFAPVFYPLIQQAGIDPYFFGLLFILNLGIGVITPPWARCSMWSAASGTSRSAIWCGTWLPSLSWKCWCCSCFCSSPRCPSNP